MSLISRIEITNYLTEGVSESRRIMDWRPMLNGITLRMDSQSALVNVTNGGGKTSLADLVLYLLGRDDALLKRIRNKCSPSKKGYTHARIEFRDSSTDEYVEPSLLQIDPANLAGETHVVGVALNDEPGDAPVFYSYSGTLEDSPCYTRDATQIVNVADAVFVKKTSSLPGCKWNKHTSRKAWEEHIKLFVSTDVVRRNSRYQLEGSDDKNASFFTVKARAGESYEHAFFRTLIAPDLLTNLLSTFAEEEEQTVEDTLHLSLDRIVATEKMMAKQDAHLAKRQEKLDELNPLLEAGKEATQAHDALTELVRSFSKDAALVAHFGNPDTTSSLRGLPRSPSTLRSDPSQDPRVKVALAGMLLSQETGIFILDKALSELTGIEVGDLNRVAERNTLRGITPRTQVIDFNCHFETLTSGVAGRGGHYRKAYSREAALSLPGLLKSMNGARIDGLSAVLEHAFDIAEAQLDTNPASIALRGLQKQVAAAEKAVTAAAEAQELCGEQIEALQTQLKDRKENQSAWDDFQNAMASVPETLLQQELRTKPIHAKRALVEAQDKMRGDAQARSARHGRLEAAWNVYVAVLEAAGLQGIAGVQARLGELRARQQELRDEQERLRKDGPKTAVEQNKAMVARDDARLLASKAETKLGDFDRLRPGYDTYRAVFGDADPTGVNPAKDKADAEKAWQELETELASLSTEIQTLERLQSQSSRFASIFGPGIDPLGCNPRATESRLKEVEASARESRAPFVDKVEALDTFEELFPGQTPTQWLESVNERRRQLEASLDDERMRRTRAEAEIAAIDKLGIVDDGAYAAAWLVLEPRKLGRRLHVVLTETQATPDKKSQAMSALSGLLSAPVFDDVASLHKASSLLAEKNIAVPLIERSALLAVIQESRPLDGAADTHVAGFIAGRYSGQVRVLLEPAYAEQEKSRLQQDIEACNKEIGELDAQLLDVAPEHDNCTLARKATEAIKLGARASLETYTRQADEAAAELKLLAPQLAPASLEVLAAAQGFLQAGGAERLAELQERRDAVVQRELAAEAPLQAARIRASQENIAALAEARKFVQLGGEAGHVTARVDLDGKVVALAAAQERFDGALAASEEVARRRAANDQALLDFDSHESPQEIARLKVATGMETQSDDKAFMALYTEDSRTALADQDLVQNALNGCNFDRAESFCQLMDKSDTELQGQLAVQRSNLGRYKKEVEERQVDIRRWTDAEIPLWTKLRSAIHELAWEVGRRAAQVRLTAESINQLEEGKAPVEAHPLYASLAEAAQRLHQKEPSERFVEPLNELILSVQAVTFDDQIREHEQKAEALRQASSRFELAKSRYCDAARTESSTSEMALNTLEIDEISQATPQRLKALVNLFARLKDTIEKDRKAAEQAREAATQAHETALGELAKLMRIAETNLKTLDKVMARYPSGRFFVAAEVVAADRVREILNDLKDEVEKVSRDDDPNRPPSKRADQTQLKQLLRDTLIGRMFHNPSVEFKNGAIWGGARKPVTPRLSTGQLVALEFMWIVRQAEFEVERGLADLTPKQAARSRASTNRVIVIDGIFSSLSDRTLIKEAMNGLKDLWRNFQIIGLLHSNTWVNDYSVFPVYHVGKKLGHISGKSLITFAEGREPGTIGVFSSFSQPLSHPSPGAAAP